MLNLEAPGEQASLKISETLLRILQKLFESNLSDFLFNPKKFTGSHPVSFAREHFSETQEYLVCEKSDGVRYLLFLPEIPNIRGINECQGFLIDRKNIFWKVNVLIPSGVIKGHSLFDVELVLDHETDRRLLVFDTLFINSICFMHNNYWERLQAAWYNLVYPLREAATRPKRSIEIYLKDFFRTSQVDFLWNQVCPSLPHKCDGLIFTAVHADYIIGSNQNILKWKPNELNTVDFYVRNSGKGVYFLCTFSGKGHEKFAEMKESHMPGITDGTIVECFKDGEEWKVYKVRSDKLTENTTETAARVVKSIEDNVSIEEIIRHFCKNKKQKTSE
jgi:mRNA guanylyltransferase